MNAAFARHDAELRRHNCNVDLARHYNNNGQRCKAKLISMGVVLKADERGVFTMAGARE